MKKMKALVKTKAEPGIWMEEVSVPSPNTDEVLIKVHKTAICGTDLHIYNWDDWSQRNIKTPLVIGHEFAGVIEEVGSQVKGLKVGDIVSGEGHIVCGECRNCLAGRRHLCTHTVGLGVHRQGAYAEYLSLPAANVWLDHANIPMEIMSFFDPLGNAVHTTLSFDLVGEDVLITGAGPIGIMAVKIARHAGARHIVITDVNDYRLELARKMGASMAVNVNRGSIESAQKAIGMREGFDIGLEMSGVPSAFRAMIDNVRPGAKIGLLGILPSSTEIDWGKAIFKSLTMKCIYGREMFETWYKMSAIISSGLDFSPVLTHRFPIDQFIDGFEIMKSGNCGKVVLDWTQA